MDSALRASRASAARALSPGSDFRLTGLKPSSNLMRTGDHDISRGGSDRI